MQTVADRLDQLLDTAPADAPALTDRDRRIGYAALRARVAAVAGALQQQLSPGDRVAVWLPKSLECVVALFAIARAGAVAVPVNPMLKSGQLLHILQDSGARLLLTHKSRA
ncbi:MAG: AMP-binding protein, partial [Sandaracinobacteroides sp.]